MEIKYLEINKNIVSNQDDLIKYMYDNYYDEIININENQSIKYYHK